MFQVELAPLGGILGPLKSDLGVFWAKIPLYPYNVKFSNSIFSKSPNLPILSFWILNLHIIICQFQKRSTKKHFLSLSPCSCHLWIIFANYRRVIEGRRSWKDWGYQRCQLNKKHEWWQKPPAKASRALPDASGGSRLNIGELFWAILGVRKSFFTTRSR